MIRLNNEIGRLLLDLLDNEEGRRILQWSGEVSSIIRQQLDAPTHYNDLVDTIAKVVQDPRVNKIQGSSLDALRKAILQPVELARFRTMADKHTNMQCGRCGTGLADYETTTIISGMVYCYRCAYPEVVTCQTCHETVPVTGINRTTQRALERHSCVGPRPPGPPDEVERVEPLLGREERTAQEQAAVAVPVGWSTEGISLADAATAWATAEGSSTAGPPRRWSARVTPTMITYTDATEVVPTAPTPEDTGDAPF